MTDITHIQKEKMLFWTLAGLLCLCAYIYIYSITSTIRNVVATEDIHTRISELTLELGEKEFAIINTKNNISLSYAHTLGFIESSQQTFITKRSVSFLSEMNNEI